MFITSFMFTVCTRIMADEREPLLESGIEARVSWWQWLVACWRPVFERQRGVSTERTRRRRPPSPPPAPPPSPDKTKQARPRPPPLRQPPPPRRLSKAEVEALQDKWRAEAARRMPLKWGALLTNE